MISEDVHFEPVAGGEFERVRYAGVGLRHRVYFEDHGVRFLDGGGRGVRLYWPGSSPGLRASGAGKRRGTSSYFTGNDPAKWKTGVEQFDRIVYREAYPGIDVVFYGQKGELEFDFLVQPGADIRQLRLALEGAGSVGISGRGELVLQSGVETWTFRRPVAYQTIDGVRKPVVSNYAKDARGEIRVEVGEYDSRAELVIDPSLVFSTYFGGAIVTEIKGVTRDAADNIYITGKTAGGLPFPGTPIGPGRGVFVSKFSGDGSTLLYSVYLGGTNISGGNAIAVDALGSAYVAGDTQSIDFPTVNPVQAAGAGIGSYSDAFVFKLNPAGTALVYSTYLGGSATDYANAIAVDGSGNAIVTGQSQSSNFPIANAVNSRPPAFGNIFVTKMNSTGSGFVYSTFLGYGLGSGVAVDALDNTYITGWTLANDPSGLVATPGAYRTTSNGTNDSFLVKLSPNGATRLYATYLGVADSNTPVGVAVDGTGNAYVVGTITAYAGGRSAYLAKVNPAGSALVYGKTLAASAGAAMALTPTGSVYIAGTVSGAFAPVNSMQPLGSSATFVAMLDAAGSTWNYVTVFGAPTTSPVQGLAADSAGNAIVVGYTYATDFPLLNPFQPALAPGSSQSGFLAKIAPCAYGIDPLSKTFTGLGGTGAIAVTAAAGCQWTAVSNSAWVTVTSGAAGTGDGAVAYTVDPYPGFASRTAKITLGGSQYTVTQTGQTCVYSLNAAGADVASSGDIVSVAVTSGAECKWTSSSPRQWAAIQTGATGGGNGTVTIAVGVNPGTARSVVLTIAGLNFRINQRSAAVSAQPQFAEPILLPAAALMTEMKAADFNGDGKGDIAAVTGGGVAIFLGDGAGGLTQSGAGTFTFGGRPMYPYRIAVADFTGDGKPDVLAVSYSELFAIAVFPGNGNGTLGAPIVAPQSTAAYLAAVADIDRDGRLDLLFEEGMQYVLYRGRGDGSFNAGQAISVFPTQATELTMVGDVNGDGIPDLVACRSNGGTYSVYRGLGPVNYAYTGTGTPLPFLPKVCYLRDVNRDGKLDLLVGGVNEGILMLPGKGDGTFGTGVLSPNGVSGQLYAVGYDMGDVDSDGQPDFVVVHNSTPFSIATVLGDGSGGYVNPRHVPLELPVAAVVVDVDGDGKQDVVVSNRSGSAAVLSVLLNATVPPANTPPEVVAGTPVNPSGSPQTFRFVARDTNGFADVQRVYFLVNADTNVPGNTCHGFYDRVANGIYLYSDGLATLLGPLAPGAAGTLQNGQCSIDGAGSAAVTGVGTDLPITLAMSLRGTFGATGKNVYAWAIDKAGNGTGWVPIAAWTPAVASQPPVFVSSTPGAATGAAQAFTLVARDPNGYANLSRVYFVVNTAATVPVNSCHGFYDRVVNGFFLYNDGLTALLGPLTPGAAGTLQNSQCTIDGATSTPVTGAGTDLSLKLGLGLSAGYGATGRNLYVWVTDAEANGTGWVQAATWAPAVASQPPVFVSSTPAAATGAAQAFTLVARDPNGFANLSRVYFVVNTAATVPVNSCHGFYDRAVNAFFLYNDGLTALLGPLAPGAAGTLQNSQCTIDGATSTPVTGAGTDLSLKLGLGLSAGYGATGRNLYVWVTDAEANGTGWVQAATWAPAAVSQPPVFVSATPASGAGYPQTFGLVVRDTNGVADLQRVYFVVNTAATVPASTCHGYYDRVANAWFLYSDGLAAVLGPLTPGTAGTLQNSQCAIDGAASAAVTGAGTDMTLTLALQLSAGFRTPAKSLYLWVTDNEGNGTGWVPAATWGAGGNQAPVLASASPGALSGANQTLTVTARDADGNADLRRVYFVVNTTGAVPANSCHGFYDRGANAFFLYNDSLTVAQGPLTPGAGTLQNSQCTLNGAGSGPGTATGTDLPVSLSLGLRGAFATGNKSVYVWLTDASGAGTGWVPAASWSLP